MFVALLIIIALLAAVVGFFSLSEATMGLRILAVACFLGILARIVQASAHQTEIKKLLQDPLRSPILTPPVHWKESEETDKQIEN